MFMYFLLIFIQAECGIRPLCHLTSYIQVYAMKDVLLTVILHVLLAYMLI